MTKGWNVKQRKNQEKEKSVRGETLEKGRKRIKK